MSMQKRTGRVATLGGALVALLGQVAWATDTIVITGAYTDCCDLSTAFDAANRDFRVIVPRDIVAGYSEEAEDAALHIISLHVGLVVESGPLLAEWYARAGEPLPELTHVKVPQAA